MNVLIATGIFPPDIGGPATYVPAMGRALTERGHEVHVLTASEPENLSCDDSAHPFPVQRLNLRLPIWWRTPHYTAQIVRQGRGADVIYANGLFLEAGLANRFLHKPLVMKIVGDEAWERATRRGWSLDGFEDFQRRRQSWVAEMFKAMRSWAVRRANKVIVPSQYLRRVLVGWGVPQEQCTVIYNAVNGSVAVETKPTEVPISPRHFSNGKVRLITVGRLVPWKGVDLIIRALADLPRAVLTVVGDGPCRGEWETLAATQNVSHRVWFTGALPRTAVTTLLREHDVFALASSYEGLPHILLEAMEAELAVVATAVGGTPEIVRDGFNGLLIEPSDTALYGPLCRLVRDDQLRRRLAATARRFVQEHFSTESMVRQTEQALLDAYRAER